MNVEKWIKNPGLRVLFLTALCITALFRCNEDDDEPNRLANLEVQLQLADGLSDIPISGIPVKIANAVDNSVLEASTGAGGKVVFENIAAGTYSIVVSQQKEEYTLSGTVSGISVVSQKTTIHTLKVRAVNPNAGLVIKEVYSVGANDGYASLFKDQFIEIFNNASETLYADGLYIANLYGETGTSGNEHPITDALSIKDYVYADAIDQVPGEGKDYPIAPGKSITIALNAINFKEGSPKPAYSVDNTDVTLERYSIAWLEAQGREGSKAFDFDNPKVPNMTNIYLSSIVYLFNSYGTGVVLVRRNESFSDSDIVDYTQEGSSSTYKLMKIPVTDVIDGVEILENSQASSFKRIPPSIDAGFHYLKADGDAFYSSMSSRRKKDEAASKRFGRVILQDTNNSTVDFEAIDYPDKYGYNQ